MEKLLYEKECYNIIGACMTVHKNLGNGFLESIYQEVLAKEFRKQNIPFKAQQKINMYYEDEKLNKYFIADFVCYDKIIVELKAVSYLNNALYKQVINYLKASNKKVGFLINFGEKSLKWKRFINT